jgi:hypothetical protein
MWAIDVVHRAYLDEYLTSHFIPFAEDFATRVLAHTTETATGEAFAAGMGSNCWDGIESRLKPARIGAAVKRTKAVPQNLMMAMKPQAKKKPAS